MVVTCIADFWGKKVDLNEDIRYSISEQYHHHNDAKDVLATVPRLHPDDGILPPGDYEYKDLLNMKEHYCDLLGHKNHHVSIAAIISLTRVTTKLYIRALAVECLLYWIEIERRTDTAEITYVDLESEFDKPGVSASSGEEVKVQDAADADLATAGQQGKFAASKVTTKPDTLRSEALKRESATYIRQKRYTTRRKVERVLHDECCAVM
jgi:hypothetical protein